MIQYNNVGALGGRKNSFAYGLFDSAHLSSKSNHDVKKRVEAHKQMRDIDFQHARRTHEAHMTEHPDMIRATGAAHLDVRKDNDAHELSHEALSTKVMGKVNRRQDQKRHVQSMSFKDQLNAQNISHFGAQVDAGMRQRVGPAKGNPVPSAAKAAPSPERVGRTPQPPAPADAPAEKLSTGQRANMDAAGDALKSAASRMGHMPAPTAPVPTDKPADAPADKLVAGTKKAPSEPEAPAEAAAPAAPTRKRTIVNKAGGAAKESPSTVGENKPASASLAASPSATAPSRVKATPVEVAGKVAETVGRTGSWTDLHSGARQEPSSGATTTERPNPVRVSRPVEETSQQGRGQRWKEELGKQVNEIHGALANQQATAAAAPKRKRTPIATIAPTRGDSFVKSPAQNGPERAPAPARGDSITKRPGKAAPAPASAPGDAFVKNPASTKAPTDRPRSMGQVSIQGNHASSSAYTGGSAESTAPKRKKRTSLYSKVTAAPVTSARSGSDPAPAAPTPNRASRQFSDSVVMPHSNDHPFGNSLIPGVKAASPKTPGFRGRTDEELKDRDFRRK